MEGETSCCCRCCCQTLGKRFRTVTKGHRVSQSANIERWGPLLLRRLSNPNGTAGFHVSRAVVSFFGFAFERRVFAAWLLFLWWPFRDRQLSSTHTESYNILLAAKRKSWIDTPPPTWPYCRPDGKMSKQLDDVFLSSPWDSDRFESPGYLNWWIWFLFFASPSDADVGNFWSRLEQKRLPWRKFDKRLVLFGRQQCHEWRKSAFSVATLPWCSSGVSTIFWETLKTQFAEWSVILLALKEYGPFIQELFKDRRFSLWPTLERAAVFRLQVHSTSAEYHKC